MALDKDGLWCPAKSYTRDTNWASRIRDINYLERTIALVSHIGVVALDVEPFY